MRYRVDRAWAILWTLCVTEIVSWGVLVYSPAVFLLPMERELGWTRAEVAAGPSIAMLTWALSAVPVGRWLDRHGTRALMTAGSCAATLLTFAWAAVASLPAYYAIWAGMGVTMAAVLYQPAFAAVTTWFTAERGRALTILSLAAALASTCSLPLAAWLLDGLGWRSAVAVLGAVLAVVTIPLHAVVLRQAPAATSSAAAAAAREISVSPREAVRSTSFLALAVALILSAIAHAVVSVHAISFLVERGYSTAVASGIGGALGAMQIPGRLLFAAAGRRVPARWVTASIFLLQAVGLFCLAGTTAAPSVAVFVVCYGMGMGMTALLQASRVAEFYGPAHYGTISGVLAGWLSAARAVAPVTAGWVYGALGGYEAVLWTIVLTTALAAAAGRHAELAAARRTAPGPEAAPCPPCGRAGAVYVPAAPSRRA